MEEVENKKNKNTKKIIILVVFLAVFAIVILMLVNLFSEKTTITTGGTEVTSSSSLYCTTKSKNIPDAFFDLSSAESADQAIKVLFKNNQIDSIAYNANMIYSDVAKAQTQSANLLSHYNLYIQETGKNGQVFSPNFSTKNNTAIVSLFAKIGDLNSAYAKIFLIDTNDVNLNDYTPKVLSALYKSKGFSCDSNE